MRLHYYRDSAGNFGDDLNAWLWPRLIPEVLEEDDGGLLVGAGTLLNDQIPAADVTWVFGSGAGYGAKPRISGSWKFFCVRGPLTAAALGLPRDVAVTDAAALVSVLLPAAAGRAGACFMPHHVSKLRAEVEGVDLRRECERADVRYLDPAGEPDGILAEVQASEIVLGEAMHACVVADALRVPWIPVRIYDHLLPFKWSDWCGSLELEYAPEVFAGGALEEFFGRLRSGARPRLSKPAVFDSRVSRLQELLAELRGRHRSHLAGARAAAPLKAPTRKADSSAWLRSYYTAIRELDSALPAESAVVLLDEEQWAAGASVAGRRRLTFMERQGFYGGPPADGASAVEELTQLRERGAGYLVVAWPAYWWLDYYCELRDYLAHRREILRTDRVRVFELAS